jgi:2-hydroxy-3-keto-5-methylthiopentenyl-1-phosphate phosphatase
MARRPKIFCDFDGTITTCDTIDVLLEKLADPEWKDIEAQWERGEIGSRECMAKQVPLIRGGWKSVLEVLDTVKVDKSFSSFVSWCRQNKIPVFVVSDGIDRVIEYLLAREGVRVDAIYANRLQEDAKGQLSLSFVETAGLEHCLSGVCKCDLINSYGLEPMRIIIGDGRSDFCWSKEADVLFAKSRLAKYCEEQNVSYLAFQNFTDVRVSLQEILTPVPQPASVPVPQPRPVFTQALA